MAAPRLPRPVSCFASVAVISSPEALNRLPETPEELRASPTGFTESATATVGADGTMLDGEEDPDWLELYGQSPKEWEWEEQDETPAVDRLRSPSHAEPTSTRNVSSASAPSDDEIPPFRPPVPVDRPSFDELSLLSSARLPPLMSNALARRPPQQLREIAPIPRPSSSSRLSVNEVFPSFAPVTPATLSPYLHLGHPPSPPWSLAFYRSHAQFLLSCLPVPSSPSPTYQELSLASSGHLLPGGAVLPPLSLFTLAHAPNRAKLQADFVPWDAHEGAAALPRDVRTWLRVCAKVVAWLWDFDEAQVGEGDVLSVIQGAPREVHFLIREYADVLRIAALLARLERAVLDDLHKLQNSADLAPKQRAALVLLEWMLAPRKEQERKVMLLKKREDCEEPGWKDWLKRADEGERTSAEALDEWEQAVQKLDKWEQAVQKLDEWEKAMKEFEAGLASSKSLG